MGSQIFISHSHKDQKVARTICTALENRGLKCWVYSRNIQPGQNFQEQIVKAIRAAKIMVLVFTANANSSNEIKKELALASQNNLVVIPVRIEDVIPNEAFAYEFATRQWIDLFEDWESSIARLADLISTSSEGESSSDPVKTVAPGDVPGAVIKPGPALTSVAPWRQSGSRWALIGGAAVIIVAAIAYGVVKLRQQPAPIAAPQTAGLPVQPQAPATSAAPALQQPAVNANAAPPPETNKELAAPVTTPASDPLRLNLVTDCDRMAEAPGDPDAPPGVPGIAIEQIDIVPALTACSTAMRLYPDLARFTFQAGRVALAQKDFVQARQLDERAVAAGSRGAMNGLGLLYQRGSGVPQDYAVALNWYQKAAAAGWPLAYVNLGNTYIYGRGVPKDYDQGRTWLEKAAAAGQAEGMSGLGVLAANGWGVPKDYATARQWFEKSAAVGSASGMSDLGNLYFNGYGVPKDYDVARTWFMKGAAAGNSNAMSNLGNLFLNGYGVTRDYGAALQWFEKAADAGNSAGMVGLGLIYASGDDVPQDYAAARTWYAKAAAAGSTVAMADLGYLYYYGNGAPKDYVQARQWFQKAADASVAGGMNGLGLLYFDGDGVPKDYTQARQWFEKAAAAGGPAAMNNLGNLYYNGNGVPKDLAQARAWYAKAAAAGYAAASTMINKIDSSKR